MNINKILNSDSIYLNIMIVFTFLFGLYVSFPMQDFISSSQVLAGITKAIPNSVDSYTHNSIKSLIIAIGAISLKIGISEVHLSRLFSAVTVTLINVSIYKILLNKLTQRLAFICTFLFVTIGFYKISQLYDIAIFKSYASYGYFSFAYALFLFSLILEEKKKLFYFLLGLMFSIHGYMALIVSTIVLPVLFINKKSINKDFLYFILGIVLSIILLFVIGFEINSITNSGNFVDLAKFIESWDIHRQKMNYLSSEFLLCCFAFLICIKDRNKELLGKLVISSSILTIITNVTYNILYTSSPSILISLMPQRISNFVVVLFPLYIFQRYITNKNIYVISIVGLALSFLPFFQVVSIQIYCYILIIFLFGLRFFNYPMNELNTKQVKMVLTVAIVQLFISFRHTPSQKIIKNVDIPAKLLECPSCNHFHRYYRKNTILNVDDIDVAMYDFKIIRQIQLVLEEVYGLEDGIRSAYWDKNTYIDNNYIKNIWESRTSKNWKAISKEYNFEAVVTPSNWVLDLSLEQMGNYNLYTIKK